MANYQSLKAAINAVIKANGNKEITGTVLNEVLLAMVNSLGAGYQFAGVATPSTNPGTPDQKVFYIASQAGTYTNFGGIVIHDGITVLLWNGSWSANTVFGGDDVFDISAYRATGGTLAKYANLSAALDGGNNVPSGLRKGGMTVKYVQSSDNKYVQFRCMAQSFTTDVTQWQGVDDEPTAGSDNLVKSGGVYEEVSQLGQDINNKVGILIDNYKLAGVGSNWAVYNSNPIFVKGGEIFTVKLTGPLTFAGTDVSQTFLIVYLTKLSGGNVNLLTITAEQQTTFDSWEGTFTAAQDSYIKVEGRWQTTEKLNIYAYSGIYAQVEKNKSDIANLPAQIASQQNKRLRGVGWVLHCSRLNFNNISHKAEINGLVIANPENATRLTIPATEVDYDFNSRNTSAVWLVYDFSDTQYKFIFAGENTHEQIVLACLDIIGNSDANPNTSTVLHIYGSPIENCYINGENADTRISKLGEDLSKHSYMLGEVSSDVTAELGLLLTGSIYTDNVEDSSTCLCSNKYIYVGTNTINVFHASDIQVRVIEYDSNLNFIKRTGYDDLSKVLLQPNTVFVRISADYSARGYSSSNPITTAAFVAGDFGFTYKPSSVAQKISSALIFNYQCKPYFVDGSTWTMPARHFDRYGIAYSVVMIPVVAGQKILVKSNNEVNTRIAFINTFDEEDILANAPKAIDGIGNQNTLVGGNISFYTVPEQCTHIALSSRYGNANSLPASLIIDGVEYMSPSMADTSSIIKYFSEAVDTELAEKVDNIERGVLTSIIGRNISKDAAVRAMGVKAVSSDIKPLTLLHISDIHTKENNFICFKNACDFYKHYSNIKAMVVTGDIVWDDFRNGMEYYNECVSGLTKPVLNVIGNHDAGQWHVDLSSVSTDKQCYDRFISPYVNSWGVIQPNNASTEGKSYYYKDFADEKIRLIVLCEFETDYQIDPNDATKLLYSRELRAMRQAQVDWLIATLTETPSDYGVVVAMHQTPGIMGNADNQFVSFDLIDNQQAFYVYSSDKEWLAKILNAFANKTSLSLSVSQTGAVVTTLDCSCDFSAVQSEFICVLCGHTHKDYIGRLKNYPSIPILCVGADNLQYTSSFQPRAAGTPSEDLFNVINIDRNRKTIKVIRIGSDASVTGQVRDQLMMNYANN